MIKNVFAVSAVLVALCGPAFAAPPAPFNWNGFYVGANGGYAWRDSTVTFTGNDSFAVFLTCGGFFGIGTCPPPASFHINGGLGGLQSGYNWQLNHGVLLGIEADFDRSRIRGAGTSNFVLGNWSSTFVVSEKVDWFGTVKGRLGFVPTDRLFAYGTAGLAYGGVKHNVALNSPFTFGAAAPPGIGILCLGNPCLLGNSSRIAIGWTAGGGFEYAAWNNVSIRVEYLYVNLGKNSVNALDQFRDPGFLPTSFNAAYSQTDFHTVRIAVNYLFSTR